MRHFVIRRPDGASEIFRSLVECTLSADMRIISTADEPPGAILDLDRRDVVREAWFVTCACGERCEIDLLSGCNEEGEDYWECSAWCESCRKSYDSSGWGDADGGECVRDLIDEHGVGEYDGR